jgi:hypothetical protein
MAKHKLIKAYKENGETIYYLEDNPVISIDHFGPKWSVKNGNTIMAVFTWFREAKRELFRYLDKVDNVKVSLRDYSRRLSVLEATKCGTVATENDIEEIVKKVFGIHELGFEENLNYVKVEDESGVYYCTQSSNGTVMIKRLSKKSWLLNILDTDILRTTTLKDAKRAASIICKGLNKKLGR